MKRLPAFQSTHKLAISGGDIGGQTGKHAPDGDTSDLWMTLTLDLRYMTSQGVTGHSRPDTCTYTGHSLDTQT